ncbi:hypothetical protein GW17_00052878 [Ensete ventricosum]|nr:hypothetical protein GW17_00052878 [Ensete ventricosum]
MNISVLTLSVSETELVEILQEIVFASRGVKDMNETWLAEAVPSTTSASVTVYIASSMDEKHPRVDEGESLKKRSKKAALEQPANASRSTNIALVDKGKGSMEIEEAPERGYTIRDLCEVEDRVEVDKYFASIMPSQLVPLQISSNQAMSTNQGGGPLLLY